MDRVKHIEIHFAVDRILMKYGKYDPLELLLSEEFLDYEDYRRWRKGDIRVLDGVLKNGGNEITTYLERARCWAIELRLVSETVIHNGWQENRESVLTPSSDRLLNELLSFQYRPPSDDLQSNLFSDSGLTAALHTLSVALISGDIDSAHKSFGQLEQFEPGDSYTSCAKVLIDALELPSPEGLRQGIDRIRRMEQDWIPAATDFFGPCRRDFLVPLWRGIGKALEQTNAYNPEQPHFHASRAYREGLDWRGVKRSILAVSNHTLESALLARLAEAHGKLGDRAKSLGAWFTLCRIDPEEFERLIERTDFPDPKLQTIWFNALNEDLDPTMSPRWFPAWMLLEEPSAADWLDPLLTDDFPSRAFDLVKALLAHPHPDKRGIELRNALKAIHPGLLKRFLSL